MPMGILFWVVFVIAFLFGMGWITAPVWGSSLVLFVLLGLLGWKVFGPVLQ